MSPTHERLCACLRSALAERCWSQQDGANAAEISIQMLKKILAGTRSPTLRTLEKIAEGWQYPELWHDLG